MRSGCSAAHDARWSSETHSAPARTSAHPDLRHRPHPRDAQAPTDATNPNLYTCRKLRRPQPARTAPDRLAPIPSLDPQGPRHGAHPQRVSRHALATTLGAVPAAPLGRPDNQPHQPPRSQLAPPGGRPVMRADAPHPGPLRPPGHPWPGCRSTLAHNVYRPGPGAHARLARPARKSSPSAAAPHVQRADHRLTAHPHRAHRYTVHHHAQDPPAGPASHRQTAQARRTIARPSPYTPARLLRARHAHLPDPHRCRPPPRSPSCPPRGDPLPPAHPKTSRPKHAPSGATWWQGHWRTCSARSSETTHAAPQRP